MYMKCEFTWVDVGGLGFSVFCFFIQLFFYQFQFALWINKRLFISLFWRMVLSVFGVKTVLDHPNNKVDVFSSTQSSKVFSFIKLYIYYLLIIEEWFNNWIRKILFVPWAWFFKITDTESEIKQALNHLAHSDDIPWSCKYKNCEMHYRGEGKLVSKI